MNKFCSSRPSFWLLTVLISGCMLVGNARLSAQMGCSLACNFEITVEIPVGGSLELFPSDMLEGDTSLQCPGGVYRTQVEVGGNWLPATGNFVFDASHIGQTFVATVQEANSGQACWGEVHVQSQSPLNDTLEIELCALLWKDAKPVKGSTFTFQPSNPSFPYSPVVIELDTNQNCTTLTVITGDYLPGTTFSITAEGPNLEAKNGLDLADLCGLTKHILGIEPLGSPYSILAGDVNSTGTVTTYDIVLIRNIMMGRVDTFPNTSLWKSFPEGCTFVNPNAPLPVPASCVSSLTLADLVALDGETLQTILVKTGDISGNVQLPGVQNDSPVLSDPFLLSLPIGSLDAGSSFSIPVKAGGDLDFGGLQASILINTNLVEFDEVESGAIQMITGATHYWDETLSQLQILISPNSTSYSVQEDEVLFYIRVNATQMSDLEDVISLNLQGVAPSALGGDCTTIYPVESEYAALVATEFPSLVGARVQAPSPNPFTAQTILEVDLIQGENAVLEVVDLNGQILFSEAKTLAAGKNRWEIPASVMPEGSMAIWQLRIGGEMTAGKLVRQ